MNNEKTNSESDANQARSRRVAFRFAAVLVGLLPFVLLEIGLRCLDAGRPADSADRTTDRKQAFIPGASPPLQNTPIRMIDPSG